MRIRGWCFCPQREAGGRFYQITLHHITQKKKNKKKLPRHCRKKPKPRLKIFNFIEITFVSYEMKYPDRDRHELTIMASFDKTHELNE
jgi:hypothetical protein